MKTPDQFKKDMGYHGCLTGDCPHTVQMDCFQAIYEQGKTDAFNTVPSSFSDYIDARDKDKKSLHPWNPELHAFEGGALSKMKEIEGLKGRIEKLHKINVNNSQSIENLMKSIALAKHIVNENKKRVTEVVRYCSKDMDYMWAATVTGTLLGCDFKDAYEESEKFLKSHEKGLEQ